MVWWGRWVVRGVEGKEKGSDWFAKHKMPRSRHAFVVAAAAAALVATAAAQPGITRVPLYRHNNVLDTLGGASRSSKNVAVRVRGSGWLTTLWGVCVQTGPLG